MVNFGAGMIKRVIVHRPVPKIASWTTYVKRTCIVAPSVLLLCASAQPSSWYESRYTSHTPAIQRA